MIRVGGHPDRVGMTVIRSCLIGNSRQEHRHELPNCPDADSSQCTQSATDNQHEVVSVVVAHDDT